MKHLNLKLEKLEERIAPGGMRLNGNGSKTNGSQGHGSQNHGSRGHGSKTHGSKDGSRG